MSLDIEDVILDEEYRDPATETADETEEASLSAVVVALIEAQSDPGDFVSPPPGFPQYAANAIGSDKPVTDYFLAYNALGEGWPAAGVATGMFVGTEEIYLFGSGDDNLVFGRIGGATGDIVLAIAVDDSTISDASVWIALYAPLVHDGEDQVDSADELDLTDLIYLGSDFDTTTEVPFENFASVPSGQDAFALVGPTSGSSNVDLLITGFAGTSIGTVNVSTQGLGTNAQKVDEGESLRIDIVDANAANFANADEPEEVHDATNIGYAGGHKLAVGATFEIEQINPTPVVATVTVHCYDTTTNTLPNVQGSAFPQDAIDNRGTEVQIDVEDVIILNAANEDITATFLARGGTIVASGDGVRISGLLVHEQVKFTTDDEFTRFTVTNSDTSSGPDAWDLGAIKVTVLEGGEDTEFAELGSHLIFQDDGPLIEPSGNAAPTLTVDETYLTTDDSDDYSGVFGDPDYGADGEGSIAYALGVALDEGDAPDSGLVDTATGNAVFLFLAGGVVIGREGTDAADAETGDEVFRITVDADGNVELDQSRAIVHADNEDPDDISAAMAAGLITLTATAYDSEPDDENDSDSATVDIGDTFLFKDDGPTLTPQDPAEDNNLVVDNVIGDTASSSYGVVPGADGFKSIGFVGPDSDGDFTWAYYDVDGDSTIGTHEIRGYYKDEALYEMTIDEDGNYTIEMIGTLPPEEDRLNVNEIKAGGPDTNFIDVGTTNTEDFCRLSGFDANGAPASINESNANVGVKNGNLDNLESIKFELFAPDGDDANSHPDPITFLGLNIGTKSAKASDYLVSIDFVDPNVADLVDVPYHVEKNGTLSIGPFEGNLIQSITIEKQTGPALKLGLGDIEILRPPSDAELDFTVRLFDGDDDWVDQGFTVGIDGDLDGDVENPISLTSLSGLADGEVSLKAMILGSHGEDANGMVGASHGDVFVF